MFMEKIGRKEIEYFSITIFREKRTTLSYCNNNYWLKKYNKDYILQQKYVPVQKYILGSASKLIVWDACTLDKCAKEYIKKRNSIVGVSTNISILIKKNESLAAVTLGTKKSLSYLLDFISSSEELVEFEKNILRCL